MWFRKEQLLTVTWAGDPSKPQPPSDTLPRVLIDRLAIEAGQIDYVERDQPTPLHLALQPLGLVLEQLSTLPSDRGRYLVQASLPEQAGRLYWPVRQLCPRRCGRRWLGPEPA